MKDPHERPIRLLAIGKCRGRDTSNSAMWLLLIHYLDGRGIRAISCLYILEDIMQAIAPNTDPRYLPQPCDYFGFIAGTSSAGLLAIMLGYLRMSIMECIDAWEEISKSVFDWPKAKMGLNAWLNEAMFDYTKVDAAIKKSPERRRCTIDLVTGLVKRMSL